MDRTGLHQPSTIVAPWIKNLRSYLGISQASLAMEVGLSDGVLVYNYEKGHYCPDFPTTIKFQIQDLVMLADEEGRAEASLFGWLFAVMVKEGMIDLADVPVITNKLEAHVREMAESKQEEPTAV